MFRKLLSLYLLCNGLCGYASQYMPSAPPKFWFSIQSEVDTYNSQTGFFTRKYLTGDSTIYTKVDELKDVYAAFVTNKFLSFPTKFSCKEIYVMPLMTAVITMHYKNRTRKSTYFYGCLYPVTQGSRAEKFKKLEGMLWRIIMRQKAVKSMKSSDVFFM